jgi:hypothetical protein
MSLLLFGHHGKYFLYIGAGCLLGNFFVKSFTTLLHQNGGLKNFG